MDKIPRNVPMGFTLGITQAIAMIAAAIPKRIIEETRMTLSPLPASRSSTSFPTLLVI